MAKAKKAATKVGKLLETTIIFPKKTVLEELTTLGRETKKRTQSQTGKLGQAIAQAAEDHHLDRKAFGIARQLEAMDDERLHITYHSLLDYCEKMGITKRATAQEELFVAGETEEPSGKFGDADKDGDKGRGNVSTFEPRAARTAEAAE